MPWIDICLAALAVAMTVLLHVPSRLPLRPAIAVLAAAAGAGSLGGGLAVPAALHAMVLLVALIRTALLRNLIRLTRTKDSAAVSLAFKEPRQQQAQSVDWLLPYMTARALAKDQHLFRAGDAS